MVEALKKIKNIFLPALFILIAGFEADAQFSFQENNPIFSIQNDKSYSSELTKPRRGFTKRRYGRHVFYLEGGYFAGYYTGKRYSINYELIAQSGESNALTLRLGYGQNEATNDSTYLGNEKYVPIAINILIGQRNLFELGLGGYYYTFRKIITPYASIGFRHMHPKGGFTYRLALDIHLERLVDAKGKELQKTAVFGPIIGLGWTF